MGKRFTPPTLEQCEAYKADKGYKYVDAPTFFLFYESKGWKVGKNKMVSWHCAKGGWEARGEDKENFGKIKLYPIKGKTCSKKDCGMPAVYKRSGEYDWYHCSDHLPAKVKEQYY